MRDDYWDSDYEFDFEYEYAQDEDHFDDYVEDQEVVEYAPAGAVAADWERPESEYDQEGYDEDEEYPEFDYVETAGGGISPLLFVFLAILFFAGFTLLIPLGQSTEALVVRESLPAVTIPAPTVQSSVGGLPADSFVAPYDDYWITQGVHGTSYGHMAVDIAAGKGSIIRSPIAGRVTENTIDGVGNTMLVIENSYYQVTMLHGDYTAKVGDEVSWGDKVGEESNHGYTMDMQGRLCTGRDCGYHTHLNVYDKLAGRNVNPLNLLSSAAEQQLVVGSRVQRAFELP